jgi:fructokinase
VVDTVGAGDAFTALLMLGECLGWDLGTTLQRGLEFAEAIVTTRGATTDDRELYRPFLRRWTPQ